jgi:hypothetical protein
MAKEVKKPDENKLVGGVTGEGRDRELARLLQMMVNESTDGVTTSPEPSVTG